MRRCCPVQSGTVDLEDEFPSISAIVLKPSGNSANLGDSVLGVIRDGGRGSGDQARIKGGAALSGPDS